MKKIKLTSHIEYDAYRYGSSIPQSCRENLIKLRDEIKSNTSFNQDHIDFLACLIRNIHFYCIALPEDAIKKFDAKLSKPKPWNFLMDSITVNGFNSNKPAKFWEFVVEALQYKKLRSGNYFIDSRDILINHFENVKIRTCVYCNRQFAVTTKNGAMGYQLDHIYPKKLYPYLAINFYNLIPTCSVCNGKKSDRSDVCVSMYSPSGEDLISIALEKNSIVNYIINGKVGSLSFDIKNETTDTNVDNLVEAINLKDFYNCHKDIAEEILVKSYTYSPSMLRSLEKNLNLKVNKLDLYRIWYNAYKDKSDVFMRPLNKMTQDIVNQVEKLKMLGHI